jgi:hypothetical protein
MEVNVKERPGLGQLFDNAISFVINHPKPIACIILVMIVIMAAGKLGDGFSGIIGALRIPIGIAIVVAILVLITSLT